MKTCSTGVPQFQQRMGSEFQLLANTVQTSDGPSFCGCVCYVRPELSSWFLPSSQHLRTSQVNGRSLCLFLKLKKNHVVHLQKQLYTFPTNFTCFLTASHHYQTQIQKQKHKSHFIIMLYFQLQFLLHQRIKFYVHHISSYL